MSATESSLHLQRVTAANPSGMAGVFITEKSPVIAIFSRGISSVFLENCF